MAESTTNTVFQFHDGTTLVSIECDLNSVDFGRERTIERFETFCAVEKAASTNVDTTIQLEGLWRGGVGELDEIMDGAMADSTARAWQYDVNGSDVGDISYSGTGFISTYNINASQPGAIQVSITLDVDGAVTRTIVPV